MDIRKLAPGDRLLDYRLLERLGEGGFGEVFRAEHEVLSRVVAIKVPRDQGSLQALRHEGVVQAALDHPNIVRTLELSVSHDPPYVVMEFVDGSSLAELIRREGALPWRRAARVLLDVARALGHAHSRGVVHGDVKPGNVLVEKARKGRVLLTDFGLGRVTQETQGCLQISRSLELHTSGSEVQGTIRYLAPEILRGETADARADIYSFGVLLFETLTGRLPEGREVPSDLVRDLPEELDRIFARTFTRKERRPSSFESTIGELEQLVEGGLRAPRAAATAPSSRPARKSSPAVKAFEAAAPAAPEAPANGGVVRAIPADSQPALPALPAPTPGTSAAERHRPVTPLVAGEASDPGFARWRDTLVDRIRDEIDLAGVVAGDPQGFDLTLGVEADGEPHHRVFLQVAGRLDLAQARTIATSARRVFEREKGIWEKEVTFCVLAREVADLEQVLWTFKSFSMGWWRRRRMVLHDLAQDRLYATELGCDPQGNPLKRAFLAAAREAVQATPFDPAPLALCSARRAPRGTAWGAGVALVTALAVLGSLMAVEFAARCAGMHRHGRKATPVFVPPAASGAASLVAEERGVSIVAAHDDEEAAGLGDGGSAAVLRSEATVAPEASQAASAPAGPAIPERAPDQFVPCEPVLDEVY